MTLQHFVHPEREWVADADRPGRPARRPHRQADDSSPIRRDRGDVRRTDDRSRELRDAVRVRAGARRSRRADRRGALSTFQYDTFGRARADHPGGVIPASPITARPPGTSVRSRTIALGQYDVTTTLDSLRRTVATTTTGRADGKAVSTETVYDTFGRVHAMTRPHFAGVTFCSILDRVRQLGRVTSVTNADGSSTTTTYLGLQTTSTNADGNMSSVTVDSLGRPVTSIQATSTGAAGLSGDDHEVGLWPLQRARDVDRHRRARRADVLRSARAGSNQGRPRQRRSRLRIRRLR